ncbi:hypothetical protein AD950_06885 [Gluconobacter oxydans]|nr:hypothetical protein AD950_06885 [Gluconobacter oxydans]
MDLKPLSVLAGLAVLDECGVFQVVTELGTVEAEDFQGLGAACSLFGTDDKVTDSVCPTCRLGVLHHGSQSSFRTLDGDDFFIAFAVPEVPDQGMRAG